MSLLTIIVNGEPKQTGAETLGALCVSLGFGKMKIATALNGEFVPAPRRDETRLNQDDRIEIVAPRQGG